MKIVVMMDKGRTFVRAGASDQDAEMVAEDFCRSREACGRCPFVETCDGEENENWNPMKSALDAGYRFEAVIIDELRGAEIKEANHGKENPKGESGESS